MSVAGRSRPILLALLSVPVVTLLSACGREDEGHGPVYPTRGRVSYRGEPAVGALVTLSPLDARDPEAPKPHGEVDAEGAFRLSTYEADDGAPAGHYAVTLFWPAAIGGPPVDPYLRPDRLRGRYGDPEASPLRAEIRLGTNELEPFRIK